MGATAAAAAADDVGATTAAAATDDVGATAAADDVGASSTPARDQPGTDAAGQPAAAAALDAICDTAGRSRRLRLPGAVWDAGPGPPAGKRPWAAVSSPPVTAAPTPNQTPEERPPSHHIQVRAAGRDTGMFLRGMVSGTQVEWLVDTGCSTTILSSRKYDEASPADRPALQPYVGTLLSADNTPILVRGCASVRLQLHGRRLQHEVIVADIANEGLLGLDFLYQHGLVINFGTKEVTWQGECVPSISRRIITQACRIRLAEDVTIPAGTRTLVPGTANKPLDSAQYVIEPLQKTPGGQPVMTGRTLVQGRGRPVPVEILNPTEEDTSLRKKDGRTPRRVQDTCRAPPTLPVARNEAGRAAPDGSLRHLCRAQGTKGDPPSTPAQLQRRQPPGARHGRHCWTLSRDAER